MRERIKILSAFLQRVSSHPLIWVAILAFLVWRGYSFYAPHVSSVALDKESRLVVVGRNFGPARGDSALVYSSGDHELEIEILEWTNERIIARTSRPATSGSVSVKRAVFSLHLPSSSVNLIVPGAGLPSQPFGYEVPVQAASPWPLFRRDHENTGSSTSPAAYGGDSPWSFKTGKGIFSTAVIDGDGVAYVGSADGSFYAVDPGGRERWRYPTGGVIDSAAALLRPDSSGAPPTVVVPSGDGYLYRLRTGAGDAGARQVWKFDAGVAPRASYNNWFEGNVAIGYDGTIYAGNTNFNYYAIKPTGQLKWTYETAANNWSIAALGRDGTIYWGSNDTFVHAVNPDGTGKWSKRTWGMITASAAIGSDGTVYIGSFDSYLYALDPQTGNVRWSFKTDDHVYASVALGRNESGRTDAIYFGSTDGRFYALAPTGELLWKYDAGDPIRSSAALGLGPEGEQPGIVYFGAGNGKLYALNAADGTRRWSFDTTSSEAELRDRNDLNSSIALGHNGVYVGAESGMLWYVPYDYCVYAEDPGCETSPSSDLPREATRLFYVSPGGTTHYDTPPAINAATVITLRLVSTKAGQKLDARLCDTPVLCSGAEIAIETEPSFKLRYEQSADGHHLHIIPEEILRPDTTYRIRVEGDYYGGRLHLGNLTLGGSHAGRFKDEVKLRTRPASARPGLQPQRDEVPAFEWTRLAVPMPAMLASLNQIGFDDMEWIMGVVDVGNEVQAGRLAVWGLPGKRDKGALVVDPEATTALLLTGRYQGDSFSLSGHDFMVSVTGIPLPLDLMELRGQFGNGLSVAPGASFFAETNALSIPTFGPRMVLSGLTNGLWDKLVMAGTYATRPYARGGPANRRPKGLEVALVESIQPTENLPGQVVAHFRLGRGARYKLAEHRVGMILVDRLKGEVVPLDYRSQVSASATPAGDVSQVVLTIPSEAGVSDDLEVVVLTDVFPLHRKRLDRRSQAK